LSTSLKEFLGVDKVGVSDPFGELGIDSLRSMILLNKIKKEFGMEMSLRQIFENQTVRELGRVIAEVERPAANGS
jgi:acyl carrier protein